MSVLIVYKFDEDLIKNKMLSIGQHFPHYKSMGAFSCHVNHSFDPICPKTLFSLSPTPMMLRIKFDEDWPTGLRYIRVESVDSGQKADHWYTISLPCEPSAQMS